MSQLKGGPLYRKRARSPYEITDEGDKSRSWGANFKRANSLDPMNLDLIQPGRGFTDRSKLRLPSPAFHPAMEREDDVNPSILIDTASEPEEEIAVGTDVSFPPAAGYVPVDLQNLWKRIEENGFRREEDFDQEPLPEHSISRLKDDRESTAVAYTIPPIGEDIPEYTSKEDSGKRYPESSGYTPVHSASRSGLPKDEFTLALAFWLQDAGISHTAYVGLGEVLQLASMENLRSLPKDIRSFQRCLQEQLPLLPIHSRMLKLDAEKIACGRSLDQRMLFFDMEDILGAILNTDSIRNKIYFGMAHLVDEP